MRKFKDHTLQQYLEILSQKKPVPGGGSATALTAALGAGLLAMVARYSEERSSAARVNSRLKKIIQECEACKTALLELVDEDALAYDQVVKSRKLSKREQLTAQRKARKVQQEVCRLCYKAVACAPFLVQEGNPHLLSDVAVAGELLFSAYRGATILIEC